MSNHIFNNVNNYLKSNLPFYQGQNGLNLVLKDWKAIQPYSCFLWPLYITSQYNLQYRVQALASNIHYKTNAKLENITFDIGAKHLLNIDNINFFKNLQSTNYSKLLKNRYNLYHLFPSMNQNLLTEFFKFNSMYITKSKQIRISANNWFNNPVIKLFERKYNYLIQYKLRNNEIDSIISEFNSNWTSISNPFAYCILSNSRFFSLFIDAEYNWKGYHYNYFRYYNHNQMRKHLWNKKMDEFWTNLYSFKLANSNLYKGILNIQKDFHSSLKFTFNYKLKLIYLNLKISVGVIGFLFYLNCFNYLNNYCLILSIIICSLFKFKSPLSINSWKFNKLLNNTKMIYKVGVYLNKVILLNKIAFKIKHASILQHRYEFYYMPSKQCHSYGTGYNSENNYVFLNSQKYFFENTKYGKTSVITHVLHKPVNNLLIFLKSHVLNISANWMLRKLHVPSPSLKQFIVKVYNSKQYNKLNQFKLKYLIFKQMAKFNSSINWLNSFIKFKYNNLYKNIFKYQYNINNSKLLIMNFVSKYNQFIKLYKFNTKQSVWHIVIVSIYLFFIFKKFAWKNYYQYSNIIYRNYGVFKGYLATMKVMSVYYNKLFIKLVNKKSLKKNKLYSFNLLDKNNINKYINSIKSDIFWNLKTYIKKLKFVDTSTQALQIINTDRIKVIAKTGKNPNYKGKNYDPNYKNKAKIQTISEPIQTISEPNPNYKGKNYDPNYKNKAKIQTKPIQTISEPNPNYKGKNYDPNYKNKAKIQTISEPIQTISEPNPNYKGRNYDPNYKNKAKIQTKPIQNKPIQTISEPIQTKPIQTKPIQTKPIQTISEPIQNKPIQNKPIQTKPIQTKPIQNKLIQNKPIQTKPVQNKPIQTKPIQNKPIQTISEPIQNKPIQTKPIQNKPIQNKPIQTKPVQNKPIQNKPIQNKPIQTISEPIQNKPIQNKLIQNKPIQTKPVQNKPIQTKPIQNKPIQTISEPIQNKPIQNKLIQNKPIQTKPVQNKPIQNKPIQTKPIQNKTPQEIEQLQVIQLNKKLDAIPKKKLHLHLEKLKNTEIIKKPYQKIPFSEQEQIISKIKTKELEIKLKTQDLLAQVENVMFVNTLRQCTLNNMIIDGIFKQFMKSSIKIYFKESSPKQCKNIVSQMKLFLVENYFIDLDKAPDILDVNIETPIAVLHYILFLAKYYADVEKIGNYKKKI